jgi:hypothetical protein
MPLRFRCFPLDKPKSSVYIRVSVVAPTAPSPLPTDPPESLSSPSASPPTADLVPCAVSPVPALPPLSALDRALLLRLLNLDEDYPTLAAELKAQSSEPLVTTPIAAPAAVSSLMPDAQCLMPPPDLLSLLEWSSRPDIATWLAYYHQTQDHHSRRLAITRLESLIKTSDSQVEQRRAATTLLRALDHKWPTRSAVNPDRQGGARNGLAPSPPRRAPIPPSPR